MPAQDRYVGGRLTAESGPLCFQAFRMALTGSLAKAGGSAPARGSQWNTLLRRASHAAPTGSPISPCILRAKASTAAAIQAALPPPLAKHHRLPNLHRCTCHLRPLWVLRPCVRCRVRSRALQSRYRHRLGPCQCLHPQHRFLAPRKLLPVRVEVRLRCSHWGCRLGLRLLLTFQLGTPHGLQHALASFVSERHAPS